MRSEEKVQSEAQLEEALISQLEGLGWERVVIADEDALVVNLRAQLEAHNEVIFSDAEFEQVLNKLSKGGIFEKAKILRDKVDYRRDDGDVGYIELVSQVQWCKNRYQVANQITMQGAYKNRYDVTLLVNGLPLVQIELKRRGLEIKEAFNQFGRYDRHSFGAGFGLFNFLQICVVSNGVNTKYFANTPSGKRDIKQTFFWADEDNKKISGLHEFAEAFLEKCQLSKMITKYVVLNESNKALMALRSYQYYAVERIVERVKVSQKNGYIWHTTGSGKTLTSFKAAQILTQSPEVKKVVFVVDRKDLDYQTIGEFNAFQEGSVDATNNTGQLVKQFEGGNKLIVTTLQKLNTAITREKHLEAMEGLKGERVVFIFDECHRSQFGETHKRISGFFENAQMFGFTGTPIFAENAAKNALGKRTTKDLFGDCLHKYVITDAIRDENVLRFSVEYIRTFKSKDQVVDIEVEAIDTKEVMEAPERIEKVVDYILSHHGRKTHHGLFNGMMCVSNTDVLLQYYETFRAKKAAGEHDLRVATIFSYEANADELDPALDEGDDLPSEGGAVNVHKREKLDEYIGDYNAMFGTNYSTKDSSSFYAYYQDIGKRVKAKQVDILLVVNMFLTGFDSKQLNTIYVDKNLRYHGLLQAYSRTNRIFGSVKSQGNVVCFRNLKSATDQAIELFANKAAQEEIILEPYDDYVENFNKALEVLRAITPHYEDVDELLTEEDEARFVQAFRDLIRIKNVLECFSEFSFDDLGIDQDEFANYRSKYLHLYDKVRRENEKEKVSILADLDFEVELISRDKINVSYIINLLRNMQGKSAEEQAKTRKNISDILDGEVQLRSKKELIERFIAEHFANLPVGRDIGDEFDEFWNTERLKALELISRDEGLDILKLEEMIGEYLFTGKEPRQADIIDMRNEITKLKERKPIAERIFSRINGFIETFVEGVD